MFQIIFSLIASSLEVNLLKLFSSYCSIHVHSFGVLLVEPSKLCVHISFSRVVTCLHQVFCKTMSDFNRL